MRGEKIKTLTFILVFILWSKSFRVLQSRPATCLKLSHVWNFGKVPERSLLFLHILHKHSFQGKKEFWKSVHKYRSYGPTFGRTCLVPNSRKNSFRKAQPRSARDKNLSVRTKVVLCAKHQYQIIFLWRNTHRLSVGFNSNTFPRWPSILGKSSWYHHKNICLTRLKGSSTMAGTGCTDLPLISGGVAWQPFGPDWSLLAGNRAPVCPRHERCRGCMTEADTSRFVLPGLVLLYHRHKPGLMVADCQALTWHYLHFKPGTNKYN